MTKIFVVFALLLSTNNIFANDKAVQAEEAYALRDFNAVGIKNVETAVSLYQELIDAEADTTLKNTYQMKQASAYYFLGTAYEKNADQKEAHKNAMDVSDEVMTDLGVDAAKAHELTDAEIVNLKNALNDVQEAILAEVMYTKGISLAQWGKLNGIASSIGRLPEVLGLMERIETLGYAEINEYGPYRTIGRINFILPSLFGGDLEVSEDYLKKATGLTLATGQKYSINGFNNTYLAETLYKRGKENQAKALIKAFIEADATTLAAGKEPENRDALRLAKELAEKWNVEAQ